MESSGELNINDLPRWIVCANFSRAGYRHGMELIGTPDEQAALLKRGTIFLTKWAQDKGLDLIGATFKIHPESERENCRVCVPTP